MIRWRCRPDLNWGVRVLQTLALPLGHGTEYKSRNAVGVPYCFGAGDEARTRYLHLGKVALYRMSYTRILWCLRSELLFCGKATAVTICHRHIIKSRLSTPPLVPVCFKKWCLRSELNQRHADFQSAALPTELQRHVEPRRSRLICDIGDPERTRTVDLQRDRLAC